MIIAPWLYGKPSMHDWAIMIGTAIIGGLLLDLQKRLSSRQIYLAGLLLVPLGWIIALSMTASGPIPSRTGAGIGFGILLTGIALLTLPVSHTLRTRRFAERDRRG